MTLESGTRLGPYQVIAPLGAGGMGEVYRARDTRLGREVAIKVLPQHGPITAEERARFLREAKAISSLNHPHICVLHDIGREGNTDYLVMELVEGDTLSRRISKGALPTGEVLRIGAQIADALDRAHRAGVVHRDLKPGNVMLTRSGAKLMDFGLARELKLAAEGFDATLTDPGVISRAEESITRQGMIVGTFQYMSPEQLDGRRADVRSDIWALGCVLYEMATGRKAFEGTTPVSVISAIIRDEPRRILELAPLTPPSFERLVRQCLAKDPDERWQSASDLKRELSWIAEGGVAGLPAPAAARPVPGRRLAWGIATVVAIGAVVLGVLSWRKQSAPAERFTFRALTFKPMLIYGVAFAPDGRTVLLSAGVGGITPRVYVIRPEYPEPQPITEPGVHLLSVSSRGELAVLNRARMPRGARNFIGTLARMPLGGGAPRDISEDVREADWSPDGAQLAVLRRIEGGDRIEYPVGHVLPGAGQFLSWIRISPDGGLVAYVEYVSRRSLDGNINVIGKDGRKRTLLRGYRIVSGLSWRPNGREILFSAPDEKSGNVGVYSVSLGGKVKHVLSSPGGVTVGDQSHDGRMLVLRDDSRSALMVHKPEWKEDRDLSWLDGSDDGRLSGDANLLAFTESSTAVGDTSVMCIRNTDGSPVVKLGTGRVWDLSRDGTKVLGEVPSNPPQLIVQPTGAGEAVRLPRGRMKTYLLGQFFPGADSVIFLGSETGKSEQIFIQNCSGGLPRPVTAEGILFAVRSPDGKYVAADGFDSPWMLYSLRGDPPKPFPALKQQDFPLRWNDDGSSILVLSAEDPLGPVQTVDLRSGRRTPFIASLPVNREGLVHRMITAITDDDRCYAYKADWENSTLFLVEPQEIKR